MPIKVFGPIEVTDDGGRPIATLSPRQRRLLAALSVDAGGFVSAERLVHRVWDDDEFPSGGVRALHTRISRLRPHLVAAGVEIATEGRSYSLASNGKLDARRFEALVDAGREAISDGDPTAGVAQLEEAIGLWRGGAYEDVADMDWAQIEIARLEEIRAEALELRFAALLELGHHTRIVPSVEEAVGESPWRERLRIQLALALYRSGRHAEALRSIARYRTQLADELGLDVGASIRELETKILNQDPELAVSANPLRWRSGYHFHEVVGEGAFSVVWRATQPALGRQVAVKQIRAQLANRPEFIRRFEVEAQLVAALEHPFVVPLHDYWREPDGAFLVMRWLRGGTLSSRLLDGPLDPAALATLIEQVGSVLRAAHAAGIIHRDVKSSNVLFDQDGNAFLGDFGIAFGTGDDDAVAEAMSTGSPAYASPEQLRREPLDARTDIYALGIVVFEAATGRLPFVAASQAELIRAQLEDPVPAPSTLVPSVPAWVDAIVAGCCAKHRDDRFATADAVVAAVPHATAGSGLDIGASAMARGSLVSRAVDTRNPYKGLRAFTESDAVDFCGRQRLVDRFLDVLARPGTAGRLLVAVGASGSGKSSAVRAGLIPALRNGTLAGSQGWLVTTMVPGGRPFEELEAALLRIAVSPPRALAEMMAADERGIARALRLTAPEPDSEIVIVIDQLEELFTLTDTEDRNRFLAGVIEALREPRAPLRVVATIRADFWDRPLRHPALASMLEQAAVTVGPMSTEDLAHAIVEPARRHGVEFAPGLVARLIADVADQPGALPLLQYTLTALFERQVDGVVSADAYESIGGIDGAVAQRAEQLYGEADPPVRAAMRRVVGELVTLGEGTPDTRRRVTLAQLQLDDDARAAVELLGGARLVTFDHDPTTREPTVEIAHEALLAAWPRLRSWIDADRDDLRAHRQLTAAATEWDRHGRDDDRLYRGARLDDALDRAASVATPLDAVERSFLAASQDLALAEARRTRQRSLVLRSLLGVAVVLLVNSFIAGLLAVGQRDDARAARVAADVDRMAAQAVVRADSDPRLALLMAAEAHARADSPESLGALQRTLLATGPILGYVGDPDRQYRDVRWIGDTTLVVAHLGGIEAYDVQTGTRTFEHTVDVPEDRSIRLGSAGGRVAFDVSPDGTLVAVGTADDAVEVIDLTTADVQTLRHDRPVRSLAFHPDGSRLATGDADGTVRMWDPRSGELLREFVAHPEWLGDFEQAVAGRGWIGADGLSAPDNASAVDSGVHDMEFLPDGTLVTAETPVVRRWDPKTGEAVGADVLPPSDAAQLPPPHTGAGTFWTLIDDIHVDPRDPSRLAVASRNLALVVGLDDGELQSQVWYPTNQDDTNTTVAGSAVTADGRWIVWLSDGRIVELDDDGAPRLEVEPALRTPAALEINPSGSRLAGAADGGVVIVSLTGEGLLAEGLPKLAAGSVTSISEDGGLVAQSGFASGPTVLHERTATGWRTIEAPDRLAEISTAIVGGVDGRTLASGWDRERGSSLVDARTGTELGPSSAAMFDQAFSPDGRRFVSHDGLAVTVWDLRSGTLLASLDDLARLPAPTEDVLGGVGVLSVDYSPDGERLVATSQDGRIAVFDAATWTALPLPSDIGPVVRAGFSPDGRFLATASTDGRITLRDPDTYETLRVLEGSRTPDWTHGWFEWSADGRLLLSLIDGSPRLWDLDTGTQIGAPFPQDVRSRSGAASGDALRLVSIDGESLKVWNLATEAWAPIACRAAGRNMTAAEWESVAPAGEPYRSTCPQFPPGGQSQVEPGGDGSSGVSE